MRRLDHPSILKLRGSYEDDRAVHLVVELCQGGELFEAIALNGKFSERCAAARARSILETVQYLHGKGVVHRDLKPENFLLTTKDHESPIKMIDFGLSAYAREGEEERLSDVVGAKLIFLFPLCPNFFPFFALSLAVSRRLREREKERGNRQARREERSALLPLFLSLVNSKTKKLLHPRSKTKTKTGTVYYMAPEILRGSYGHKADIFSVGVMCYLMLSGMVRSQKQKSFSFFSKEENALAVLLRSPLFHLKNPKTAAVSSRHRARRLSLDSPR